MGRAHAVLVGAALVACSPPVTITRVAAPVVQHREAAQMQCHSMLRQPGLVAGFGKGALLVDAFLAEHYYRLACDHPASTAFFLELDDARRAVESVAAALRQRRRTLEEFSLHMVGVRLAEGGEHVYVRGNACAPTESWMAPARARTVEQAACIFDALYRRAPGELTLFRIGHPDPANEIGCIGPAGPEENGALGPMVECRFDARGIVLPFGRGTFVANAVAAAEIVPPRCSAPCESFAADVETARAAIAAVERHLAAAPPDSYHQRRTLADYHVQIAGVECPADECQQGGRRLYVAGSCSAYLNNWLMGYLTAVADGGTCYFDAYYDPATGRLTSFQFHGEA